MKKGYLLILSIFIYTLNTNAQFSITGEYRVRGEANHGLGSLPVEESQTAFFISQRTRLNMKYENEKFTSYFSLQDVRLWGQEDLVSKTGVNYSSIGVDISQAWFDWKFAKNWGLKTGRQIWSYDDGRILASRNWNQTALSWDALFVHLDKDDFHFHFGSSINNTYTSFNKNSFVTTDNPFEMPYGYRIKYFNFIWLNFQINKSLQLSFSNYLSSYLAENTNSTIYSMMTHGLYFEYKNDDFSGKAEVYYQYGKNGKGSDVSAYMFAVFANYKTGKFKWGAGLDYYGGDQSDNDKYNAFDIMYGGRHKFNGWLNFYNLPSNTNNKGLIDVWPNITYTINKKHQVFAKYHFFSLEQESYTILADGINSNNPGKNIGGELDFNYTYKFDKSFKIEMFFSYYFATETTELIKGVESGSSTSPYWLSLMLTYKPDIFSSK